MTAPWASRPTVRGRTTATVTASPAAQQPKVTSHNDQASTVLPRGWVVTRAPRHGSAMVRPRVPPQREGIVTARPGERGPMESPLEPPVAAPPGLPPGATSDVVEEAVALDGRTLRMLRPRDGDAVLDELLAEDDPEGGGRPLWDH